MKSSAMKKEKTAAHTPGEWRYEPERQVRYSSATGERLSDNIYHWVVNDKGVRVACGLEGLDATDSPNARLTAAAPDMLEEIWNDFIELGKQGANSDINHPLRKDWERKRALIAKATKGGA